ncbi:hypothetical protein Q0601_18940 [Paracoccus onubensis]|uniref:hypothetical protein n=1 Tax=Paracoccus onubensis TaxID=1675788 RepID=UPI002730AE4F|nr:hypothetical protein [Paracoccus onubensis]MDP0929265.1 hypothetical protein [Paracoccus onubensis]
MNKIFKLVAVSAVAATLAACAGPAPKKPVLSAQQAQQISVREAQIDVSAIGAATSGRKVPASTVRDELRKASGVLLWSDGPRDAVAVVKIDSVNIIGVGQTVLIGGESTMRGSVSLVDAKTQDVIVPPQEISSGGGGYTPGGLIGAATLEDKNVETTQLATEFMRRARLAIYNPNPQ